MQSLGMLRVPELYAAVQGALGMPVSSVSVPCCRSTRAWPRPEPGAALMSSIASQWQCCLCAPHSTRWVHHLAVPRHSKLRFWVIAYMVDFRTLLSCSG